MTAIDWWPFIAASLLLVVTPGPAPCRYSAR